MAAKNTDKSDAQEDGNKFEVQMADPQGSEAEMKQKRDEVMQRRQDMVQKRMAAMAQRRMKRSGAGGNKQQKETLKKFESDFNDRYNAIEDDIAEQKTHDEFKDLKLRAFKLESYLADNASILPSYTFEAKNRMMTNLKDKINAKQEEIAPKPKFVFSTQSKAKHSPSKPKSEQTATTEVIDKKEDDKADEDILSKLGINDNEIKIEGKKLETIYRGNGSVNGSDLCLSNLVNCTVSICDHIGALRMDNIKHCTIITGPISSSLHVEHIENSTINAVMRQCRIHYCNDTKFYIHCNSEPVIEHSDNVQFAPYNVRYKELTQHWKQSDVDQEVNRWDQVKDFNWFKQQQSPHWRILSEAERNGIARPVMEDDDDDEL